MTGDDGGQSGGGDAVISEFDLSDNPEMWDRLEHDDLLGFGALEKVAEAMAERMEYELRGAWRAGYDRVDVYDPIFGVGGYRPESAMTQYVYPAYEDDPRPSPDGAVYRHSYDLTSVPDDVLRRAIRGELLPEAVLRE